jgi:ribosomal protein S19
MRHGVRTMKNFYMHNVATCLEKLEKNTKCQRKEEIRKERRKGWPVKQLIVHSFAVFVGKF